MEKAITIAKQFLSRTTIDYLLIIVPILVSVFAVFVSIDIAKKQNKIALFEKRYYALSQIKLIFSFSAAICNAENRILILTMFDSFFGTKFNNLTNEEIFIQTSARIEVLRNDVLQIIFLYKKNKINVEEIIDSLKMFITEVALDLDYAEQRDNFCKICDDFYETDFKKMAKAMHLK